MRFIIVLLSSLSLVFIPAAPFSFPSTTNPIHGARGVPIQRICPGLKQRTELAEEFLAGELTDIGGKGVSVAYLLHPSSKNASPDFLGAATKRLLFITERN